MARKFNYNGRVITASTKAEAVRKVLSWTTDRADGDLQFNENLGEVFSGKALEVLESWRDNYNTFSVSVKGGHVSLTFTAFVDPGYVVENGSVSVDGKRVDNDVRRSKAYEAYVVRSVDAMGRKALSESGIRARGGCHGEMTDWGNAWFLVNVSMDDYSSQEEFADAYDDFMTAFYGSTGYDEKALAEGAVKAAIRAGYVVGGRGVRGSASRRSLAVKYGQGVDGLTGGFPYGVKFKGHNPVSICMSVNLDLIDEVCSELGITEDEWYGGVEDEWYDFFDDYYDESILPRPEGRGARGGNSSETGSSVRASAGRGTRRVRAGKDGGDSQRIGEAVERDYAQGGVFDEIYDAINRKAREIAEEVAEATGRGGDDDAINDLQDEAYNAIAEKVGHAFLG